MGTQFPVNREIYILAVSNTGKHRFMKARDFGYKIKSAFRLSREKPELVVLNYGADPVTCHEKSYTASLYHNGKLVEPKDGRIFSSRLFEPAGDFEYNKDYERQILEILDKAINL